MADAAAAFLLKLVQALCELEPDLIVVAEPAIGGLSGTQISQLEGTLGPLVNSVRFYNAFTVLVPGQVSADKLGDLIGMGFDGVALTGIDVVAWQAAAGGRSCALGLAVPSATLLEGGDAVRDYLEKYLPGGPEPGVFVTTEGDVPAAAPPDSLKAVMNRLTGA